MLTAGLAAAGTAAAIGAFTVFNGNANTANDGDAVAGQGSTTSATGAPDSPRVTSASPVPGPTKPPAEDETIAPLPKQKGVPETAVKEASVPVYWTAYRVANTSAAPSSSKSDVRLFRTFHRVSGYPAVEAVRLMSYGKTSDPDYQTMWRGAEVNSVRRFDDVVLVDFKRLPQARLDKATAKVAVQQLVYTVQGALQDNSRPIQITEGGKSGHRLFGQIDTRTPIGRAQALDVQALVSITAPAEGSLTKSPVVVSGTAAAFEAHVNYRATNLKTGKVIESYAMSEDGSKLSSYKFDLRLDPGPWLIEAFLVSNEDGTTVSDADSKQIQVGR